MEIALGISIFLLYVYSCADAQQYIPQQVKYDDEVPSYDGIHYKSDVRKEPISNSYESLSSPSYPGTAGSPYPQSQNLHHNGPIPSISHYSGDPGRGSHYQLKNPPIDHPQVVYYRQPESHSSYHTQDHTSHPEELQLSHGVEPQSHPHAPIIHPQTAERPQYVPRPSYSSHLPPAGYQTPKVADHDNQQIYPVAEPRPPYSSLTHLPSAGYQTPKVADHDNKQIYPASEPRPPYSSLTHLPSAGYQTPKVADYVQPTVLGYQTPKVADYDNKQIYPAAEPQVPQQSHATLIHPQPVVPAYQAPKAIDQDDKQIYTAVDHGQQSIPQQSHTTLIHPQPEYQPPKVADHESAPAYKADPQPANSRVVRDPRLPLYFTMYEKRIIQDPVDRYGKGPWRYLTYGHGITYGSKEPGKVFERGYGYIRALGRDHCKLPENKCPRKDDDKPFEYEGRKEPYFGYRPH